VSNVQPPNQTAISISARAFGRYAVIRVTGRLAVADGKRTILSFIYLLLFKQRTPEERQKLQTLGNAGSAGSAGNARKT
jgi:hypothetical protein